MSIYFHADDYAYNVEVSKDILDCAVHGTLDGISIMPNSPYFFECMEMLFSDEYKDVRKKLILSIHFSLSEGPCVCDKSEIPLLVNEEGMFKLSFLEMLLLSFSGKKKELSGQIKKELSCQLERCLKYIDELNVDSHVHYHMIPLVLKSMFEVIKEKGMQVNFMRIPAEPLSPFILTPKLYKSYDIVNIVKNITLNILFLFDRKILKNNQYRTWLFFGIVMTGHMDVERVSILLNKFKKIADKKKLDLEVLAHPGHAKSIDTVLDKNNLDYAKAPLSEDRLIEKQMFMEIQKFL